ncbi:uncharacterized protein LOC114351219 [Ostrinia furnacalis]|uniref:uncharacterized protein LOC114351219 n=1 Tax=Ostrinia furnacalis TaxID=93504 RepID=UPI00103BF2A8|nr:uncharacterized protein LOC114351219 [Ostrinia furnacalis]
MSSYGQEPSWQRDDNMYQNNIVVSDPLAIIYNEGLWRLNKVSPMYNLQYGALKLKLYASKIRQSLVSSVAANTLKYTVTIEEQPHLKYSEEDANGIVVTVSSTQENNAKTKVAYSAIFVSWGVSCAVDGATHLPYMLEKGEQRVGTAVKAFMQTMFDCHIHQFVFTQRQLLEFGFTFIESDTSRTSDQFTFIYKTPRVDHKDKLKLSFDIGDVHIIWNGIKEEAVEKSELINRAYQILQNQIFYMIMLDITVFDLCEISLPKAEVKSSGIVKMKTPEMVNCVFTVLNEISLIKTISDTDSSVGST